MLAVLFRKVVCSFLLIRLTRLEHVRVDDQNAVTDRDGGTLSSSSCSNPLILRAQIRLLGSRSGLGSLHQDCFDSMIALANTSTEPFAATLVVAWADPDQRQPGRQLLDLQRRQLDVAGGHASTSPGSNVTTLRLCGANVRCATRCTSAAVIAE